MSPAFAFQTESGGSSFYETAQSVGQVIAETLRALGEMVKAKLPELLAGVLILILFWLIAKLLNALFLRATQNTLKDVRVRILISRFIIAIGVIVGIFAALSIIIPTFDFTSLMAGLGVTSVVIGIAARDIVNNIISGILILWQRPFNIGDHIFVGNEHGKVEYIGVRATNLRTDDGELILIPNGTLYTNAITIRGAGEKRRMTFSFCLPYTVDLENAKSIILNAIRTTENVVDEPSPNVLTSEMTADGIVVNAAFWLNTSEHNPLGVLDRCLTSVHSTLRQNGIVPFDSAESEGNKGPAVSKQGSNKSKNEKDDLLD